MSRVRKSEIDREAGRLGNDVAVAELERRPTRTRDGAMVIDGLPVRADKVDIVERETRRLDRGDARGGERLPDPGVQFGDVAYPHRLGGEQACLESGVIGVLVVTDERDPRWIAADSTDGHVDGVGARAGDHPDDRPRRLRAERQEAMEAIVQRGGPEPRDSNGMLRESSCPIPRPS